MRGPRIAVHFSAQLDEGYQVQCFSLITCKALTPFTGNSCKGGWKKKDMKDLIILHKAHELH